MSLPIIALLRAIANRAKDHLRDPLEYAFPLLGADESDGDLLGALGAVGFLVRLDPREPQLRPILVAASRGQVFRTLAAPACRRQQLIGDEDHRLAAASRTRRHGTQVGPLDGHESRGAVLDVDHDNLDAPLPERPTRNGEDVAETWV